MLATLAFPVKVTYAHHESCMGIANPERIVGCVDQTTTAAMLRCRTAHQGDEARIVSCEDDALTHAGRRPGSSNDPRTNPTPYSQYGWVSRSGSTGTGSDEIDNMLVMFINILTAVAGLAIVGSIIVGGIQYMTAGGNAAQVSSAKNRIVVSIASLFLLSFGYAILQWLVPGGIF